LIYDADDFTKQWYKENLGVTQVPVALRKPAPDVFYQAIPPSTGYGTDEDSMGSVIALQPKMSPRSLMMRAALSSFHSTAEMIPFKYTKYAIRTVDAWVVASWNARSSALKLRASTILRRTS
jgi:hypothetical protein